MTCLKAYISSVADAELDGDDELLAITAAHASSYAVQLIKSAADPAVLPCKVRGAAAIKARLLLWVVNIPYAVPAGTVVLV